MVEVKETKEQQVLDAIDAELPEHEFGEATLSGRPGAVQDSVLDLEYEGRRLGDYAEKVTDDGIANVPIVNMAKFLFGNEWATKFGVGNKVINTWLREHNGMYYGFYAESKYIISEVHSEHAIEEARKTGKQLVVTECLGSTRDFIDSYSPTWTTVLDEE